LRLKPETTSITAALMWRIRRTTKLIAAAIFVIKPVTRPPPVERWLREKTSYSKPFLYTIQHPPKGLVPWNHPKLKKAAHRLHPLGCHLAPDQSISAAACPARLASPLKHAALLSLKNTTGSRYRRKPVPCPRLTRSRSGLPASARAIPAIGGLIILARGSRCRSTRSRSQLVDLEINR